MIHGDPGDASGNFLYIHCEVIRLDCDLLLMDIVNVSSRVRTIAYRMYNSCSVQYTLPL